MIQPGAKAVTAAPPAIIVLGSNNQNRFPAAEKTSLGDSKDM